MSHTLVKILIDQDGDVVDDPLWHLGDAPTGDPGILCTGEFYTYGCADGAATEGISYEQKTVKRGGITCERCLDHIWEMKSIRL